ncbi:hypothetical protein GCM10017673_27390 [Streptosporangium violaceochromogenes]|nr:hypothetical protein GCM10017673_27390 [Streptosporangium violaceochromogenes]
MMASPPAAKIGGMPRRQVRRARSRGTAPGQRKGSALSPCPAGLSVPGATMGAMDTTGPSKADEPPEETGGAGRGHEVARTLRAFALRLPESREDHPWGETVVKVNKKIFLFLRETLSGGSPPKITVKLPRSNGHALAMAGATPSSHGLGRAGWVTIPLTGDPAETEVLLDWVEESYRAVAPKRLTALLDTTNTEASPD